MTQIALREGESMTLQVAQIGLAIDTDLTFAPAPFKWAVFVKLLFVSIKNMQFARLIELVTGSRAYHTVIAVTDHSYVGAEPGGVVERQEGDLAYPTIIWSDFPLTARNRYCITAWLGKQAGKPYAYIDDLIIGVALLTKNWAPAWLWAALEKRLSSDGQWECAELCDAAYRRAGIHIFDDDRPPGAVYPGSFEPVFRQHAWWPQVWG